MDYSETIMNNDDQFRSMVGKLITFFLPKRYGFKYTSLFITTALVCLSCIPNSELDYPSNVYDFSTESVDPALRADAQVPEPTPDLMVIDDMNIEDMLMPDLGPLQPLLRTTGVDFVGEPQSTYNGVEPTIRGRYLWVLPDTYLQSDPQGKNK